MKKNHSEARKKMAAEAAADLVERVVQKATANGKHGGESAQETPKKAAHLAPYPATLSVESVKALIAAFGSGPPEPVPMLYGKIWLDPDPEGRGVKLRAAHSRLSELLGQPKLRFFAGFVPARVAPEDPAPDPHEDIEVDIVLDCIEKAWAVAEDEGKAKAEAAAKKK